jgi:hypothetical protein
LPHNFWSSYEYLLHYQSGDSRAHWVVTTPVTNKPTMLSIFRAIFWTHLFSVPVLRSTANHTPLKCECPQYWCVGVTHVYLRFANLTQHKF